MLPILPNHLIAIPTVSTIAIPTAAAAAGLIPVMHHRNSYRQRHHPHHYRSSNESLLEELSEHIDAFYMRTQPHSHTVHEKEKLKNYVIECGHYLQDQLHLELQDYVHLSLTENKPLVEVIAQSDELSNGAVTPSSTATSTSTSETTTTKDATASASASVPAAAAGAGGGVGEEDFAAISQKAAFMEAMSRCTDGLYAYRKWEIFTFGSESWGTSGNDSDVDMAVLLNFENRRPDKTYLLQRLAEIILENDKDGVLQIKLLLNAKYPIIRITQLTYHIKIDVSIADRFCKRRDQLVYTIIQELELKYALPAKKLIVFIKHWSKQKGINNAYLCFLNSFGYTLMVIKFLQYYCLHHVQPNKLMSTSLGYLVYKFFEFFAKKYKPHAHAVAIAESAETTCNNYDTKGIFAPKQYFDSIESYAEMEINDPVHLDNNVAHKVGPYQCARIKYYIQQTYQEIKDYKPMPHTTLFAVITRRPPWFAYYAGPYGGYYYVPEEMWARQQQLQPPPHHAQQQQQQHQHSQAQQQHLQQQAMAAARATPKVQMAPSSVSQAQTPNASASSMAMTNLNRTPSSVTASTSISTLTSVQSGDVHLTPTQSQPTASADLFQAYDRGSKAGDDDDDDDEDDNQTEMETASDVDSESPNGKQKPNQDRNQEVSAAAENADERIVSTQTTIEEEEEEEDADKHEEALAPDSDIVTNDSCDTNEDVSYAQYANIFDAYAQHATSSPSSSSFSSPLKATVMSYVSSSGTGTGTATTTQVSQVSHHGHVRRSKYYNQKNRKWQLQHSRA